MLSRRSIALNINNLSDARYFAAYEVDALVYAIEPEGDNLGLIKEVIEWVEGPESFIQLIRWDDDLARFALAETGARGLLVREEDEASARGVTNYLKILTKDPVVGQDRGFDAVVEVDEASRSMLLKDTPFYILPQDLAISQISEIIDALPEHGFAFIGGDEEKVGFKSFEDQDEYIDLLMA